MVDFNDVIAIFQEFGPRRRIPVSERWQERFPDASVQELAEWEARCRTVEREAYELAEAVMDEAMTAGEAQAELGRRCPELNAETLAQAYSQALWFVHK